MKVLLIWVRLLMWLLVVFFATLASAQADFTASTNSGCFPLTVNFNSTSTPAATAWSWDFGNSSSSTQQNPSAVYSSPGIYTVSCTMTVSGSPQIVVKSGFIRVFSPPTANFVTNTTAGCSPLAVIFSNTSTVGSAPVNSFLWDFGNGVTSTQQNPQFTYSIANTYNISLVVTDTNGCSHTRTRNGLIRVDPKPNAEFASSNNNGCNFPHTVNFTNLTTANVSGIVTYNWSFGDGNTTTAISPSNTYNSPGQYNVTLVATNSIGCRDTMRKSNFVNIANLNTNFSSDVQAGCPPLRVNFTNSSSPNTTGTTYVWDFGNNQSSRARDTSMLYINPGQYTVKLLMIAPNGCRDSLVRSQYINALPRPTARINVDDSAACRPPLRGQFTSNPAASYLWRFGDGTTSTQQNPLKIYNDTGLYTVSLRVTGTNGCSDSVNAVNLMKIRRPEARFRTNRVEGCRPLGVSFSNTSLSVAPITQVFYRLGDGNTSTNAFPTHTYQDTGLFLPRIFVTTDDGCIDSALFDTIKVGIPPKADFIMDKTSGCRNQLVVKFTNLTNTHPVKANKWEWSFQGFVASRLENPEILFDGESKKYNAQLVAFNRGCPDTLLLKDTIEVFPPTSKFDRFTAGCNADSVYFVNRSDGGTNFFWNFGDGATDTDTVTSHIYQAGNWLASLIVFDSLSGCRDTSSALISVSANDNLKFRGDTLGCTNQTLWFFDQTPGSSGWVWDFGNGTIVNSRNAAVTFRKPGKYTVRYSAIVQGCRTTTVKQDFITILGPDFDIQTTRTPICAPKQEPLIVRTFSQDSIVQKGMRVFRNKGLILNFSNQADTIPFFFEFPSVPQDSGYITYYEATDSRGCFNFIWDTLKVYRPISDYSLSPYAACDGVPYLFTAEVKDTTGRKPYRFRWEFGDGAQFIADSVTAFHKYTANGNIDAKLFVTDSIGCTDTVIKKIDVQLKPLTAGISANNTFKSCPPFFVLFRDSSANSLAGISKWEWKFGDGSESDVSNPGKIFVEPGSYTISLKVTDTLGCMDSISLAGYINLGGTRITYTVDTVNGCEPLLVKINSQTIQGQNASIQWDMRDGSQIINTNVFNHTFNKAGQYIPIAFVSDSSGCQYALPFFDTINVFTSPKPDFNFNIACLGDSTRFINTSDTSEAGLRFEWEVLPGVKSSLFNFSYRYSQEGLYPVRLRVENAAGCGIDSIKMARVSVTRSQLALTQSIGCLGASVPLAVKQSAGDGQIINVQWFTGQGTPFNRPDSSTNFNYTAIGVYKPFAIVTNEFGCKDTTEVGDSVLVGGNSTPPISELWRASVWSNDTVELAFDENTAIDFQHYIIYRQNQFGRWDSVGVSSKAIPGQYFDPGRFNLDNNYRYKIGVRNVCNLLSDTAATIPHRTINLSAFTADDASYLQWTPYQGFTPLRYEIYRLNQDGTYNLLKVVDGSLTEAYDSAIVCNTGYFYKVLAVGSLPQQLAWSDTSGAIPNYIPFVEPAFFEAASIVGENAIELRWEESPKGRVPVAAYKLQRSANGLDYKYLAKEYMPSETDALDRIDSAWYRSFFYRLITVDSCGYVSEPSNIGKTILLNVDMDTTERPLLSWTAYEAWPSGVTEYWIERLDDGFWTFIARVDGNVRSYTDQESQWNLRENYCYRVIARNDLGERLSSISNPDCANVKGRLFIPNAFNPDGRPENKTFTPIGIYLAEYNIRIFNRWGETLYTNNSLAEGWDGTYKGVPVQGDVYFYTIEYRPVNENKMSVSGTIHLLR